MKKAPRGRMECVNKMYIAETFAISTGNHTFTSCYSGKQRNSNCCTF